MPTVPLRLYATPGTGSVVSDAASLIIPRNGNIIGANIQITLVVPAGDGPVQAQLSLQSVAQFTTNDAGGVILDLSVYYEFDSSSVASHVNVVQSYVSGIRIPVVAGQKLYIHADLITNSDFFVSNVYLEI